MNIIYVYADQPHEWNCSEWRCAVPARAIQRTGRHRAWMLSIQDFSQNTPEAQEVCGQADVIVVQRNLFGQVLSAMQHWKARDKTIIVDFDDAYNLMHPSNGAYEFWIEGLVHRNGKPVQKMEPPPLTQFKWGLRLAHAAAVPSKRLADDWQSYTEMIYVPNYIDLDQYKNATPEPHEGIIIGWGGSMSHLQSFTGSGVAAALKRVCRARPQVKVMICGNDRRILEYLPIPPEQKLYHPWVPHNEWANVLAKFDIGLAPLQGPYDERRSWIKILEYMVMKIPWVASEGPAYSDLRRFGWLVKNTPSAWERVLLDVIDHLDEYKQDAAGEPYLFGIAQSIDENIEKVLAKYAEIHARTVGAARPAAATFIGSS